MEWDNIFGSKTFREKKSQENCGKWLLSLHRKTTKLLYVAALYLLTLKTLLIPKLKIHPSL